MRRRSGCCEVLRRRCGYTHRKTISNFGLPLMISIVIAINTRSMILKQRHHSRSVVRFVQSFLMPHYRYHHQPSLSPPPPPQCKYYASTQLLSSSSVSRRSSSSKKESESPKYASQPHHSQRPPPKEPIVASSSSSSSSYQLLNLSTVTLPELESLMLSLKVPKYRGQQIYHYIRTQGIADVQQMILLPKQLRQQLQELCTASSLKLVQEHVSSVDGTLKRVYQLHDATLIESVLMGPYQDGRYTACISSQVGCAQACVFCATGQMGFTRQLTAAEIFEQVATFHGLLLSSTTSKSLSSSSSNPSEQSRENAKVTHGKAKRLSNVVFMGMGEPLANYKNVMVAVNRIINELGIGARRITISTVGIVPIIRKITNDSSRRSILHSDNHHADNRDSTATTTPPTSATELLPQFRLAISLHSASDVERTALLPANARNGGLNALMEALREYCDVTGRRITIEWALIAGQNDNIQTAQQLGRLLVRHPQYPLRPDLVHVNVIPLNPTAMFQGRPSQAGSVNIFCQTLINEFGISCTPRVRRGIDIDAGCGQLTTKYRESQNEQEQQSITADGSGTVTASLNDFIPQKPAVGVYDDDDDDVLSDDDRDDFNDAVLEAVDWDECDSDSPHVGDDMTIELINDDNIGTSEAERLISLVRGSTINLSDLDKI